MKLASKIVATTDELIASATILNREADRLSRVVAKNFSKIPA